MDLKAEPSDDLNESKRYSSMSLEELRKSLHYPGRQIAQDQLSELLSNPVIYEVYNESDVITLKMKESWMQAVISVKLDSWGEANANFFQDSLQCPDGSILYPKNIIAYIRLSDSRVQEITQQGELRSVFQKSDILDEYLGHLQELGVEVLDGGYEPSDLEVFLLRKWIRKLLKKEGMITVLKNTSSHTENILNV